MTQNQEHVKLAKEASRSLPHRVYIDPDLPRKDTTKRPQTPVPAKRG